VNWIVPPLLAIAAVVGATVKAGASLPLAIIVAVPIVPNCPSAHVESDHLKSCVLEESPKLARAHRLASEFWNRMYQLASGVPVVVTSKSVTSPTVIVPPEDVAHGDAIVPVPTSVFEPLKTLTEIVPVRLETTAAAFADDVVAAS
jgi:hypothetical protein